VLFHYGFFILFRAQTLMKSRLAGAQKGHGLLKKKADALQMRFRLILKKIIDVSAFLCVIRKVAFLLFILYTHFRPRS